MSLTVDFVARFSDIAPPVWDELAGPGDFYVSSEGLVAYEELYPREASYLRAAEGGKQVTGLAWYRLDGQSRPSPFTRPDRLLARLLAARGHDVADEAVYPLLPSMLCGGRQAGPSRLLRAPGSGQDRARWLAATLATASQRARRDGASSLCFPYVDRCDVELCDALRADGWTQVPTDPYFLLEVNWTDFESYLAGFRSSRRISIRRELARLGEERIVLGCESASDELVNEMADLTVNVKRRHGSPRTAEDIAESMSAFIRQSNGSYLLTTARDDGKLAAYALFMRWRDELYGRDLGVDYATQETRRVSLYFPIMFYEVARVSPQLGITSVHYGVGSDDAKMSRGTDSVIQVGFFKPLTAGASDVLERYIPLCLGER